MRTRNALLWLGFAAVTVGCSPQVGQWVVVTDCAQKDVRIRGAYIRVVKGLAAGSGGPTDATGVTRGTFPQDDESIVYASMRHIYGTSKGENPPTTVPAGAPQPVYACIEKRNR